MGMRITRFQTSDMNSNMFLLTEGDHAAIIDPSRDDAAMELVTASGCSVEWIILTHEHCDHTAGAEKMRERFHAPVVCSVPCRENLQNPRINYSHYFNALTQVQTKLSSADTQPMEAFTLEPDRVFQGETMLSFAGHTLRLLEAPGHTTGCILIMLDDKTLFSGDTLLPHDLTNTRFPTGSKRALQAVTIPMIRALPPFMQVYPGHMEAFELRERLTRPII